MRFQIPDIFRSLDGLFARPGLSAEERYRRGYLALCFLIMTPALAVFAVADWAEGRLAEALATFSLVAALTVIFLLMPRWRKIWNLFRIAVLLGLALLFYEMAGGGGDGYVFLWFFTFPLIVFFVFGRKEGTAWVLASLAVLLVLFFGDAGFHPYDSVVGVRFMVTYGLLSALAYGLEASRRRYYEEMLAEKAFLENALTQVKTLQGLLPICAACKSVRDDQGYWNQIETYVGQHSEAEFSHGLCPQCYGELDAELAADSPDDDQVLSGG